jgi:transcriptional regulator with XRE-family HTH domain
MPTLRELRADRLLTIRALAQQAGVAPSSIHLIETRRVTPQMTTMRRIATALGVDPKTVAEFRQAIEVTKEPHRQRGCTAPRSRP